MASTNLEDRIQTFIMSMKRRQVEQTYNVAKETAEIMRMVISRMKISNLEDVLNALRETGKRLISAQPLEFSIGNVVRRTMHIAREEYQQLLGENDDERPHDEPHHHRPSSSSGEKTQAPSLYMLGSSSSGDLDLTRPLDNTSTKELKTNILSTVGEMIDELQNMYRNIAEQAIEHIHANEVIMTFGRSRTVEEFLKAAARKRKFEVIVPETAPSFRGNQMALALAAADIEVTVIPDSAIFAMMARVNKVIVGTHAVMANGGLINMTGTHMVALAAKHHAVPFVVCTGMYKLSPLYPYDQDTFNDINSPAEVISYEEADGGKHINVVNPAYDYIPPELVTLYVTNFGGHNPSYIYRLLAQDYSPDDTLE
eukprot:TRINITY_DN848_c0_g1_i1.p1 TRINITY_DN848_c0_g1~~TRINITY_DN848_c0_g1_i1.p1  ORF type:complete len:369 (-),score=151.58 TRINITY_DN848_c0_g1_i1:244-1350(-)